MSIDQELSSLRCETFHDAFPLLGERGIHARDGQVEAIVQGLNALIDGLRPEGARIYRFPPVLSRSLIEKVQYSDNFPHLLASVSALPCCDGDAKAAARKTAEGSWLDRTEPTELVLAPAACYPVYDLAARTNAGSSCWDVACDCFRREPSDELSRLQSFRMREFVALGLPAEVARFRRSLIDRVALVLNRLGLSASMQVAHDPFFCRGGAYKINEQLEQELKYEAVCPIDGLDVAVASFNYHADHFGRIFDLEIEGRAAHSACCAFGMDRLALALLGRHGPDLRDWPADVRNDLSLG